MRKISIALLALLVLLLGTMSSAAKTSAELGDLARYFPTIAPAYVGLRTDAAFIDEVGTVMQALDGSLNGAFNGLTLRDVLDQAAQSIDPNGDFATTFAWLGETAAIGIVDPDFASLAEDEQGQALLLAIALSDAGAAELFLDNLMPMGFQKSEVDGGFLYTPEEASNDAPVAFLGEDVLLMQLTSDAPEAILPAFDASLADNPDFQAALARLPLADYNAVAYVDPILALPQLEEALEESTMPMMMNPVDLLKALGPQSAGFLLLDGRNFVMDFAFHVAEPTDFEAAGGQFRDAAPIDLSFANQLPATTALMIQDTGLGTQMIEGLAQMEIMGDFYDDAWDEGNLPYDQEGLRQLDEAAVFLRQAFEGLSGLTLQESLAWMTGNHIGFLNITEGLNEEIPVLADLGLLIEVTDSAAAENFITTAPIVLEQLGLDFTNENGLIVMPVFGDMLQTDAMDLLIGQNGEVLAIGTRPTTDAVLNGQGGLADSASFQYASQFFLADTQVLAYANIAPLREIVAVLAENGDDDARDALLALSLLESGSITAVTDGNGSGTVRFVLTLAE